MSISASLFPSLDSAMRSFEKEFSGISPLRKEQLQRIADYARSSLKEQGFVRLTFICTHNSRRSHIAQLWATAAARYCGIPRLEAFSGGTEISAFNPRAVEAMRRVGFVIEKEKDKGLGAAENSRYNVRMSNNVEPISVFSKKYDDTANPHESFAAIMVCSHAEAHCPFVAGANKRLSLPYDDPKDFDGTPQESAKYDERLREIGRDMLWLMQRIANNSTTTK